MFLGKDERGDYVLDPNEQPPTDWELQRAEFLLRTWERARWKPSQKQTACPHGSAPCRSRRECLGKIVWWRRYILDIENLAEDQECERGNASPIAKSADVAASK